jgi:hypothetical protein
MCKIKGPKIWKPGIDSCNLKIYFFFTVAFGLLLVAGDMFRRMKVKG